MNPKDDDAGYQDAAADNHSDDDDELVEEEEDEGDSAISTATTAGEGDDDENEQDVSKGLHLSTTDLTKDLTRVEARWDGTLIHVHSLKLVSETSRKNFAKSVLEKAMALGFTGTLAMIETHLLGLFAKQQEDKLAAAKEVADKKPYYEAREDDDPDASGIFLVLGDAEAKVAHFTAAIDEDVAVVDEHGTVTGRRFIGHTWLAGQRNTFAIAAKDFSSTDKLKAMIYETAGVGAKLTSKEVDEIKNAVEDLSKDRTRRTVTNAHGWHKVDGEWSYWTPTGYVDANGFHKAQSGDPFQVDLSDDPTANRLGLRRLSEKTLAGARKVVVQDFLRMNDRRITYPLLGCVALAALAPFSGSMQRPALWIRGLTGTGKSFAAKLAANFFGSMDPTSRDVEFPTWGWTANRLQMCGYYFRDALYLVDDFKPEVSNVKHALQVVQAYADGAGRGRLTRESSAMPIWSIRGLLVATGEDIFQNQPSALARSIIVDAPDHGKNIGSSGIPGGYVLTTARGVESGPVGFFVLPHACTLPQDGEVTDGGQHSEPHRRHQVLRDSPPVALASGCHVSPLRLSADHETRSRYDPT